MKKLTRILCLILALCCMLPMLQGLSPRANAYASAKPLPELTGNKGQDVANIAISQLGYSEASDGGTVYGAWWTTASGSSTNFTRLGWCAMFAAWCANQAGAGMNVAYNGSAAQPQKLMEYQFANGTGSKNFSMTPKPGDFIFFSTGSSAQHVAIVVDYNSSTNKVTFVGGNQGNKVTQFTMLYTSSAKFGSQRIIGISRPNYSGETVTPTPTPDPTPVCTCSDAYAGYYQCITQTDNLNIRADHSSTASVIGSIPPGTAVYVSKAQGIGDDHWAHVEYNNIKGYASMKYLKRVSEYSMAVTYDEHTGDVTGANVEIFDFVTTDEMSLTLPEQLSVTENGVSPVIHVKAKDGFLLNLEIPLSTDFYSVIPVELCADGSSLPLGEYGITASGICVTLVGTVDLQLIYEAAEHTHSHEYSVNTQPTCENEGEGIYTCYCGDMYAEPIAALGHQYTQAVTQPACTDQGYTTHTCTRCGKSYRDTYTEATGHSYQAQLALEPDCETEGLMVYLCSCGSNYTQDVPALGHSYEATVTPADCDRQGYTTHSCTRCGKSYKDTFTQPTGHSYESAVTKAPTCEGEGVETFTCGCGHSYTQSIPATGHSYTPGVTAPTCTAQGYTAYTCICGDSYTDSYAAALGHSFTSGKCSFCGEADPEYVPPVVSSGLQKAEDGNYYYYVDGQLQSDYTGLVENAAGRWHVVDGKINFGSNGLVTFQGTKYTVKGGLVEAFTGLKKLEGTWYYFVDGVNDVAYEGLYLHVGVYWYIQNGEINFNKTDVVEHEGAMYYIKYGVQMNTFDGLAKGSDGLWRYMEKGVFTGTYTGLAKNDAGWWYVNGSLLDFSYTGLGRNHVGQWYVKYGQPQLNYSGQITLGGVTYTVKNGLVQE